MHGHVKLDGQPLDEAAILFVPFDGNRKKTGAGIVAGDYRLPSEHGLVPGRYRVEVVDNPPLGPAEQSMILEQRSPPATAAPPAKRRLLPPRYGHKSPLTFELTADGNLSSHEQNYDLQSHP